MFKVEPIDMLAEIIYNDKIRKISVSGISFERMYWTEKKPTMNDIQISYLGARYLIEEAVAYKNFWQRANMLSELIESRAEGVYIEPQLIERATDLYTDARDKCRKLQKRDSIDAHIIKREKE